MTSLEFFRRLAAAEGVSTPFIMSGLDNVICNVNENERGGIYCWTKRGARKRVSHGGLSLPECMTPVLRIQTK
jgi:hypothetical protein